MRTRTVTRQEFVLNIKEVETILQCLKYCKHRLNEHPKSGIHNQEIKEISF